MQTSREPHNKQDPNLRKRHSIRLKEYDYTQVGAYFVTIMTYEHKPILGEIRDGFMELNLLESITHEEWFKTATLRPYVNLYEDEFVVMPNHIHGIIWIDEKEGINTKKENGDHSQPKVFSGSLGATIRGFKAATTKRINELLSTPGNPFWKRNYYDRIIRNEKELDAIRGYIQNNPWRWQEEQDEDEILRKLIASLQNLES